MLQESIVDKCIGCSKVRTGPEPGPSTCSAYLVPSSKWRFGRKCPLADNLVKKVEETKFVDPLKQSMAQYKRKKQ